MARFEVTGPDGARYVVNAPDNATNEQILAYAQREAGKGGSRSPNYFDQFDTPKGADAGGAWWANDPLASPQTAQTQGNSGQWWANDRIVSPAQRGPDFPKIKRNIQRMIDQNASEQEIDEYVASEGVTAEQLRAHKQSKAPAQARYSDQLLNPSGNYFDQFDEPGKVPSWSEVPGKALVNAPESAARTAYSMAYPFLHPIETAKAVGNMAYGAGSKVAGAIGIEQDPQRKAANEAQLNAVGQFFADRYGSEESFRKTLAEDPVGVAADLAALLSGGAALTTRAPRGISNPVMGGAGLLGYSINPTMLPAFAAASPRIVGEAAYAAGKATGGIDKVLEALRVTPGLASDGAKAGYAVNALAQPQAVLSGSQTDSYPDPTLDELLNLYRSGPPRNSLALPPPQ